MNATTDPIVARPVRRPPRLVTYAATTWQLTRTVDRPGVTGPRRGYVHTCPRAAFEAVAAAVADLPDDSPGTTLDLLVAGLDLPFTQVDVALAFLAERGVTERAPRRRTRPASACAY